MPRPKAATVPRLDPLAEIRQLRARQAALREDLHAKRDELLAEVSEIDEALAELGGVGERAVAALVPKPAQVPSAPRQPKAAPAARAPEAKGIRAGDPVAAELVELLPWIGAAGGKDNLRRDAIRLRASGVAVTEIAGKFGSDRKAVENAITHGRTRMREARAKGKPGETPASDDEPAPARAHRDIKPANDVVPARSPRGRKTRGYVKQTASGAWRYSFTRDGNTYWGPSRVDRGVAERDLAQALAGVTSSFSTSIKAPKEEQARSQLTIIPTPVTVEKRSEPPQNIPDFIPTGWDRSDPDEDFADIDLGPKADPAHVHLWSPESGGTPACTLAHDAAARTTTDRGEASCPTCLAIPEPEATGTDQRPPKWVLGWLSPEVRRAYQGVALEGLSCQTMAWSEAVTPNVISGRVNGARQKVKRLLRWEAERADEGNPLTEKDREASPVYREAVDPLLAILRREPNNDRCSRDERPSEPDDSDRALPRPADQQPALAKIQSKLTEKANGQMRSRTLSAARLSRAERRAGADLDYPEVARPRTRGDCQDMPRPCPFVSCKHHLYLDVNPKDGAMKLNFPHLEVGQMAETCSLDVADRGGITLEEVGAILNLTRERIRQVEVIGISKMQDGHFENAPDRLGSPLAEAIEG